MTEQTPSTADIERLKQQMIAQEALASIGAMVPGVTHEVNTPLGVCITSLSFLRNELADFDQQFKNGELTEQKLTEFLESCDDVSALLEKNLQRAAQLIQSFKAIASNQSVVEKSRFKLSELIHDVMRSLRHETKRCIGEIKIIGAEEIELYSDAGALTQVINNLVMNSVRHGFDEKCAQPLQGKIEISCSRTGDEVEILYCDNGKGISAENAPKIFEPFFTTRRGSGGTGLGLSIIRELMQQRLQGDILYLPVEHGASFKLNLRHQIN